MSPLVLCVAFFFIAGTSGACINYYLSTDDHSLTVNCNNEKFIDDNPAACRFYTKPLLYWNASKHVYFKNCSLTIMDDKFYDNLKHVQTLSVANMNITLITDEISMFYLQSLYMAGNNLRRIDRFTFHQLYILQMLDLSHNKITQIEEFAFEGTVCVFF